jgi:hypothetical protein
MESGSLSGKLAMIGSPNAAGYVYDNERRQWVDALTGVPLTSELVIAEMRIHQEASRNLLTALTEQLYARQITIEQWQIAVASLLKDMYLAQAAYGAGGKAKLDAAAVKQVSATLEEQYKYLHEFALAIVVGLSLALALSRIIMYAIGSQQSFWWMYANSRGKTAQIRWVLHPAEHCDSCLALAAGSPYTVATLPTVPGAGATDCLSYCKCGLEFV